MNIKRILFLNTHFDNVSYQEAIVKINEFVLQKHPKYVVTPNTDIIIKMQNDSDLKEICENANLILADGEIVVKLSKFLGYPLKERIAMTDFVWNLCKLANENSYGIFLLGGKEETLENGKKIILGRYSDIKISGSYSPPLGFEHNEEERSKTINILKNSGADILMVFLGCPKQEKFISRYKDCYQIPVSITMGGCIDFIGGNIKRAPFWMQKAGFEWFFRFLQEPQRLFKRYFIDDIKIFPLAIKYKLKDIFKN